MTHELIPMSNTDQQRASRSRSHAGVTVAQFLIFACYIAWIALGDAPDPFSVGDWVYMLLPPIAFGTVFVLGLRIRVPAPTIWTALPSRFGRVITILGLTLAVLMVPLNLFGSFMDYTIG